MSQDSVIERLRATAASRRTHSLRWRVAQLRELERMLTEREADFAAALGSDLRRPAVDAWLADIASTVAEASFARKRLRRWMRPRRTGLPLSVQPGSASYRYEPLGVVLVIGPWNYPVYLTLAPVVAALAAGNCVVVKPSEHAPAVSRLLAELLPRYLDREAVAVVEGGPEETQQLLARGLDHVFFTGSPEVGAAIMAGAAPTLTPVTLELGGKSPVIVTADADIEVAARRIAWTKLMNSGQTCIAPDYVLVEAAVRDRLVAAIAAEATRFRDGEPSLPIVDSRHAARIKALLDDHRGAIAHGGRIDVDEAVGEFTVVVGPDPESALMREEIFGPVLPVLTIDDIGAAIEFVNARPKPLAIYVFSGAGTASRRVIEETSSGGVVVNHLMFQVLVPQLPFGGVGRSGMGTYHGRWGFETFSHRKSILRKPARPDPALVYPPYTAAKERLLRRFF